MCRCRYEVHAPVISGDNVIQLLETAFNAILRAWRTYGNQKDPMGRVFRKGDDMLLTQLAGVYVRGLAWQANDGNAMV